MTLSIPKAVEILAEREFQPPYRSGAIADMLAAFADGPMTGFARWAWGEVQAIRGVAPKTPGLLVQERRGACACGAEGVHVDTPDGRIGEFAVDPYENRIFAGECEECRE